MSEFSTFESLISLICFLSLINIAKSHPFCESKDNVNRIYNIGPNLAIDQSNKIWIYDKNTNGLTNVWLSLNQIYGSDKLERVDTAFTFSFSDCSTDDQFCNNTKRMRNIVIAIGLKKTETHRYGYISYRFIDLDLKPVTDEELSWGFKSDGPLNGIFWIPSIDELTYFSTAFYPKENSMFATIKRNDRENDYELMSRKLDKNGFWTHIWKPVSKSQFVGIFVFNDLIYFLDKSDIIYTIKWNEMNATFDRNSTAKEILNCFGNSSFGIEWSSEQSITDSKLESNSTTETNSIESKAETSESKAMLWVLIAILLIVLSVIAVVAIFAINRKKFTKSDNKNEETDEIHDELSDTKSMVGSRKSDHKTSEFQSKLKKVRSNESVRTVRSEL